MQIATASLRGLFTVAAICYPNALFPFRTVLRPCAEKPWDELEKKRKERTLDSFKILVVVEKWISINSMSSIQKRKNSNKKQTNWKKPIFKWFQEFQSKCFFWANLKILDHWEWSI